MGWVPSTSWSLGTRKIHDDPVEVVEAPGFTGKWVTVSASLPDVERGYRSKPPRFARAGRPVLASRQEAIAWLRNKPAKRAL
jgi:hypothetical protein